MVSSVNSVGKYPIDRELLEVIRRLQSLGVTPSGNLNIDRQKLQKAELIKKQVTLATNSEQNLNKISGTNNDFSSVMKATKKQLPAVISNKTDTNLKSINMVKGSVYDANRNVVYLSDAEKLNNEFKYQMIGATQLGELNKIRLGLIA